jgi:dienelactone hydrolase
MHLMDRLLRFVPAFLILVLGCTTARADDLFTGPWNLAELQKAPKVTWVDESGPVRKLYYESEPYQGKPTRVFAYYAEPAKQDSKLPAMVLIHGGGGKAFAEWAKLWAERGYAALAMDLAGHGPDGKRLPDGGPEQDDPHKLPKTKTPLHEMWTYHAVAAAIRGVSLLRALPQVDGERIGVTGISWGGYLTCIVAGLDDRLKVAVPVYGCGFLQDNSVWLPQFAAMADDWRAEWVKNFDPSSYLKQAKMPMLFVNGTNDFAYPLDSYKKSYRLVKNRQLCVIVNLPHGHPQGWAPVEIGLFVDSYLTRGTPLIKLERGAGGAVKEGKVWAVNLPLDQSAGKVNVQVHWTVDTTLPWKDRKWHSKPAAAQPGYAIDIYRAELPAERPLVYFATVTDERKATVSTEHFILEK